MSRALFRVRVGRWIGWAAGYTDTDTGPTQALPRELSLERLIRNSVEVS